jgi:hypothetical protein
MSQILLYRQYWLATLNDRHDCNICGELAVNAEYLESDNVDIGSIDWVCDAHISSYLTIWCFELPHRKLRKLGSNL